MTFKFWKIADFNPRDAYIFDGICFDPAEGSGSTPDLRSINYLGFVAFMDIDDYINLPYPLDHERETLDFFTERLPKQDWCIAPVMLGIQHKENVGWTVVEHEGRHRAHALKRIGLKTIPVYFFVRGMKAAELSEQFFLDMSILVSEDRKRVTVMLPKFYIWDQHVFVKAKEEKIAKYRAKEWQKIKPKVIKTQAQRTAHPRIEDEFYYWSKPETDGDK